MCGLTFIHHADAEEDDLRARSDAALNRLKHRGPDGYGLDSDRDWAMGHRRLSIIDIAGSPQPMWDPEQRHCLAYNGEVYNYRELRSDLESDWKFTTAGDTEVVLAGLLLKGPNFLDRMEGMWAIALWDTVERELLLVRDRMGKKPLYFAVSRDGMKCASELPALRALDDRPWHEDEDSTADYLRYGYSLPGYTAWREAREVLPAHFLRWRPGEAKVNQTQYWSLRPQPIPGSRPAAAEKLRQALTQSVRRRLVADVEVGAFLSGGVDSSLICAIVRKELGASLKTFTIGFADPSYDERAYAERAATYIGTEHYAEQLDEFSPDTLELLLLQHLGQPFQDSSILPTSLVSRVARQHVKVALSGDGGDELFCGYQRYQARAILRWYTRLPIQFRTNLQRILRFIPEPGHHHSHSLIKKAHLFCDIADRMDDERAYVAPVLFHAQLRRLVAPDIFDRGHPPPGVPDITEPDDISLMMLSDSLVYLPQDILTKVDRASMAVSLEARAPFLDRDVVELAFSFPRTWHRRGFGGKRMLRRAFGGLLPSSIWRRRKQGFGVPLATWFQGQLGELLDEYIQDGSIGPLRSEAIASLLHEHRSGKRDLGQRLWLIYAYLQWRMCGM